MAKKKVDDHERQLGLLSHLLGIFTSFIGPLVIYAITKQGQSFARANAREALNFQISMILYEISALVLAVIFFITLILIPLGILCILVIVGLQVFSLVVAIVGTVRAANNEVFNYPLAIPFIRG